MRIPVITSNLPWNVNGNKRVNSTTPVMTNFEGKITVKQLKKYPVERKLTHLFTSCDPGDVITVGKSFEEVLKGLKKCVPSFCDVIKRIFFVKHGGLSVPMAFDMGPGTENWVCTNIGEKPILISTNDKTENVDPTSSTTVDEGDVIINNNVNIPIEIFADYSNISKEDIDDGDLELLMNPENFATASFNLDSHQQSWIEKANTSALDSLKTKAKSEVEKAKKKLTFKDVGGLDKVVESLKRAILYPIKYPFAYKNVAVNHGVLLHGKPGTGKTLLAEALAGESDAEFIKISGTDLESKWVGETEKKWREMFDEAKEKQPSIIFIDEFDGVVKERGESSNSQYSDKVVNQILSLMSDLEKSDDNVFVIATTNKPNTIDSAILRSGRFGKQIEVNEPDKNGKKAILDIHLRNKVIDPNFDTEALLDSFESRKFTGADIKHIVNEAHTNSWVRSGVYAKMDSGELTPEDMLDVNITNEDFNLAISEWDASRTKKERKPIGFKYNSHLNGPR